MFPLRGLTATITTDGCFTSQTHDVIAGSTGLYGFLFRQQRAAQGRWLVPDPAGLAAVDLANPQTWNRYAYVGNNPLSNVDRLGLFANVPAGGPQLPSVGNCGVPRTTLTCATTTLSLPPFPHCPFHYLHLLPPPSPSRRPWSSRPLRARPGTNANALSHESLRLCCDARTCASADF